MVLQSSNGYDLLVQSLTEWQLQQIVEAIATGHGADLYHACQVQLQHRPPTSSAVSHQDSLSQLQALQTELLAERARRQAAEQDTLLWQQKFAKMVNYLRRHI